MESRCPRSEEITSLREANRSLVRNTYRYLGDLYYTLQTVHLEDSLLSRQLREMARDIEGQRLAQFLDVHLEHVVSELRSAAPRLGEKDILLFCYLTVGFRPTLIAELLHTSVNNVYTRKCRLIGRIGKLGPARSERFLELIG